MAKNRRVRGATYVVGSAARKIDVPKKSEEDRREKARREKEEREGLLRERERGYILREERLNKKERSLNASFLALLIVASSLALYFMFSYARLQTSISADLKAIEEKKQTLERLREENDALQNSIDTSIDPNEIYRVATQELGMVYAGDGEVITYEKTESEYVRQYDDIPEF